MNSYTACNVLYIWLYIETDEMDDNGESEDDAEDLSPKDEENNDYNDKGDNKGRRYSIISI